VKLITRLVVACWAPEARDAAAGDRQEAINSKQMEIAFRLEFKLQHEHRDM